MLEIHHIAIQKQQNICVIHSYYKDIIHAN